MRSRLQVAVFLLLTTLAGCGRSAPRLEIEKVVPVSGTLTFQGQPLEQYEVIFYPTDGRRAAVGLTDAEGRFQLGTNKHGDGAPPGTNTISVSFLSVTAEDLSNAGPADKVPRLRQPKIKIPAKYANPETSGITQEVPGGGLPDLKLDLQ